MFEKYLKPTWFSESIYTINIKELKENNINTLLFDLDNTLIPFNHTMPSEKTIDFINYLTSNNFKIFIVSNNNKNRVSIFADALNVPYLNSASKPFAFKLKKLLKEHNIDKSNVVLIGDQLLTDVMASKRLKIKSILVSPAIKDDLKKTKLNRFFDNKIRKKQKEIGLLEEFGRTGDSYE